MNDTLSLVLAAAGFLMSGGSLAISLLRKRRLSLTEIALRAVAYAAQIGGEHEERLRHALGAARRLDHDDNQKRDYTDAQLRIAIEAELQRLKR